MPDDFIGEDNKAEMPAEHLPIPIASSDSSPNSSQLGYFYILSILFHYHLAFFLMVVHVQLVFIISFYNIILQRFLILIENTR